MLYVIAERMNTLEQFFKSDRRSNEVAARVYGYKAFVFDTIRKMLITDRILPMDQNLSKIYFYQWI